MEQQRNLLLIVLLCVSLFLFWNWETDKATVAKMAEQGITQSTTNSADIDSYSSTDETINISSDSLALTVSLKGGDIVDAKLLKIKQEQDKEDPFHLLMSNKFFTYQAQSGLAGQDGLDTKQRPVYSSEKKEFKLENDQDTVSAVLKFEKNNIVYTKTYSLHRGSYAVDVSYSVDNHTDKEQVVRFYGQLKQTDDDSYLKNSSGFGMVASAYRGAAYSTEKSRYEKIKYDEIIDNKTSGGSLSQETTNGWVAMIQHYFVSAWIGDTETKNIVYTNASRDGKDAIIGIQTENTTIAPNSSKEFNAKLWLGPKIADDLEAVAPNLDLTVDYGWLWFISIPLFKILQFIHSVIGNWGFSIIVLTLIVRTVMFPLTKAQYTSMAKMRLLTPKMKELREKYGDDRQKLGQETMRLYKTEKVNPMGGCLPLLIQMPIFIALYWTLMESTELRQSSFILWITDLSVYDPFFVLPVLYGVSMFFLQKMSPTPINDPIQRKVFMAMPFVFTFMFCTFPAGLTLYWLVSNCFTIFQQTVIFRSLEKRGLSVKTPKTDKK